VRVSRHRAANLAISLGKDFPPDDSDHLRLVSANAVLLFHALSYAGIVEGGCISFELRNQGVHKGRIGFSVWLPDDHGNFGKLQVEDVPPFFADGLDHEIGSKVRLILALEDNLGNDT